MKKGWAGFWQGLHFPTIEEIAAASPPSVEWENVLVDLIRSNQKEQLAMLEEEFKNG